MPCPLTSLNVVTILKSPEQCIHMFLHGIAQYELVTLLQMNLNKAICWKSQEIKHKCSTICVAVLPLEL